MHARSPCAWSIVSIFLLLILISVLDNTNLIVLIILIPYLCCYYIFHILLLLSLRVLLLVRFWRTFIIFSVSISESRYRELIVEQILVQLFSGEFSFFSWLVLFKYGGWYWLWFCISYMWFYPCFWLYMHICVLSCSFLTALKIHLEGGE